ncbi:Ndd-like nucleoid disruption protein [Morganella phage vB_MmoM_MP1]|uniref:Nucleoid disruption protein n=1 Tax=Morganella phage vB_MmoM_MP1 TaxID=1852628 RepID=A0A192YCB3_9CAUD|nr:Ndd-like nucleoid disruption protein [Morganella phage vB_MmoM_MP1]ANM46506.1 nucleoid disruption protein [Morganella phage vB_MmoM_MP1]
MIMNVRDIEGFGFHVASYVQGNLVIQNNDDSEMFRPGFYFCTCPKTGVVLAMYTVGRLIVTDKNKYGQGLLGLSSKIAHAEMYSSKPMQRLKAFKKFDFYYVSVEDIKYLTNQIKFGSLRGKFSKTPTDIYNNMHELSRMIKHHFDFKFQ